MGARYRNRSRLIQCFPVAASHDYDYNGPYLRVNVAGDREWSRLIVEYREWFVSFLRARSAPFSGDTRY